MTSIRRRFAVFALSALAITLLNNPRIGMGQTPGITGKWVGVLDVIHADGSVEPGDAYLVLAQSGDAVTGSAGQSPDKLSPVSDGHAEGGVAKFSVVVNPQMSVKFDLALVGDRLHGTASGLPGEPGSTVLVEAARAGADWHVDGPVAHAKDHLFETVAALDAKLFNAYNTCDLTTMGAMVSEDLEFYHDKTGLAVGRQVFLDAVKNNICGKTQREVVPGTLEAHRLNGFGAMEIVVHRFTHPGHEEIGVGEAKSIMLWRLKDGEWQATRVISYDHGSARN